MLTLPFSPLGLNRASAAALLAGMVTAAGADALIDGYPEYATDVNQLDVEQRRTMAVVAQTIVTSHSTRSPIDAVAVIGHADKALRKPVAERAAFEWTSASSAPPRRGKCSSRRCSRSPPTPTSARVLIVGLGVGNARPVFDNAATEAQMKKNRRLEIFLFRSHHAGSRCAVR